MSVLVGGVLLLGMLGPGCERGQPEARAQQRLEDAGFSAPHEPTDQAPARDHSASTVVDIDCPDGATPETRLYDDGTLARVICAKADGTRHGPCKSYDRRGNVQSTGGFFEGKKHGEWVEYAAWGKSNSMSYRHGVKHGLYQSYVEPGVKIAESEFVDGEEIRMTTWELDGTLSTNWEKPRVEDVRPDR